MRRDSGVRGWRGAGVWFVWPLVARGVEDCAAQLRLVSHGGALGDGVAFAFSVKEKKAPSTLRWRSSGAHLNASVVPKTPRAVAMTQ